MTSDIEEAEQFEISISRWDEKQVKCVVKKRESEDALSELESSPKIFETIRCQK